MGQTFDYRQKDYFLNMLTGSYNSSPSINRNNEEHDFYDYRNYNYDYFANANISFSNYFFYFYEYYIYFLNSNKISEARMRLYDFGKFYKYIAPIMICVSLIGNVLIIIVVALRKKNFSTTAIYFCSLAVADLLVNCTNTLSGYLTGFEYIKVTYSTLDCKLRRIVPIASHCASVWQLVVISIERAVGVILPYKVKLLCTTKTAKIVVAVIWTVSLLIGVYTNAINYAENFMEIEDMMTCTIYEEMKPFNQYYLMVYNIMLFFIPFIVILVSTIVIISVLSAKKLTRSKKTSTNPVTMTLIVLNVLFLLTQAPHHIMILLENFEYFDPNEATYIEAANEVLATNVANFLKDLNNSINFFVYFLSGTRFRNDVMGLFKFKRLTF